MRLVEVREGEMEEVTCRIAGMICSKVLPPVTGPLRSTDLNHVRFLRQYVRVTGGGSQEFLENQHRLEDVQRMFESAAGDEGVDRLNDAVYEGEFAIDAHTRYFTERRFVQNQRSIPFPPNVDPNQVLEAARDTRFIRTEDNVVEYRRRLEGTNGSPQYEPLDPGEFKEGDIVEANITFIAFPLGRGGNDRVAGHKLVATLRGLTMLTSEFREKSRQARRLFIHEQPHRRRDAKKPVLSSSGLKRKYVA